MGKQPIRFEEAMLDLEEVVKKLETGEVPLEDAISLYKKGMELSSYCHEKLQNAEKQLISIIDQNDNKIEFDPVQGTSKDEE
ncbi:exodeoxyribonuclease VII small subunit [Sporosarcina sp. 6E9]|uniref:exodeoxyribonuclease VII small subunit n=1 Tax=Sporosarcina sp. 6E9 TaxID=2819235 RepID=UPI001AC70D02|nr:exodeoxyribonuclease VII small subunit [Sporosarcina sp. 6E9]MBO1913164.1 exodeoxyribonuclease VII small subunit [Microvirga sp. 3-52]